MNRRILHGITKQEGRTIMKLLSLFSGCGGMDIGFEGDFTCLRKSINEYMHPDWIKEGRGDFVTVAPTGFETVFADDIRPDAKAAWVSYFSQKRSSMDDVYHLESVINLVKKAKEGEAVFPKDIDIVTGGFPCQDFSVSGKRLGFDSQKSHLGTTLETNEPSVESRGQLYMWMRDVITLVKPKMLVAENVKGLTTLGNVEQIIEHDFSNAADGGYLVVPAKVLLAANYGVPQSRERIIFFGFRKNALTPQAYEALSSQHIAAAYDPYPPQTHDYDNNRQHQGLKHFVSCKEALAGLQEPQYSADPSQQKYSKAKWMGKHCQGQTEIKMDSIGPTIRSEHHGNIEYRRLSFEHGGKHTGELQQGLQERRLSIRECARIQTFPDNYQFIIPKRDGRTSVSSSDAYKIIGNAVPCVLAYNIAKNLEAKWWLYFKRNDIC